MAFVKSFGRFRLFQPTAEEAEAGAAVVFRTVERNRRFLAETPSDGGPRHAVTGSFVAAHAPDYVGIPTLDWDAARWRIELERLKASGMDTVILQASAWKELGECYYPSRALASYDAFDVVTPLAEAASSCGMALYLGGLGSVAGWSSYPDEASIRRELELHASVLGELAERYGSRISGFYFPCETAYRGSRNPANEAQYGRILSRFCRTAREILPGKPLLMSPSSKYFSGMDADFLACWHAIFADARPDILAPQDSIGCGGCDLVTQPAMWRLWKELADGLGIRLWANIELFERRSFGGEAPFVTASTERIGRQLSNVTPFVEKCICWEAIYFNR